MLTLTHAHSRALLRDSHREVAQVLQQCVKLSFIAARSAFAVGVAELFKRLRVA